MQGLGAMFNDVINNVATLLLLAVAYAGALAVYRVLFHPLRKFPGPKAAIASYWYEFYYDVMYQGGGQYFKKIELMHQQYGPIVRITPNEIHVDDPDWFDTYAGQKGQIREKHAPAARMAGTRLGVFGTANYEMHRLRRNAISTFFSKRSIRNIEPIIRSKARKLCATLKLQAEQNEGHVVELRTPFLAFGTDIVCDFALGVSPHGELLTNVEGQQQWRDTLYSLEDLTPLGKQFTKLLGLAKRIPLVICDMLYPDLGRLNRLHRSMSSIAERMGRTIDQSFSEKNATNVFAAILSSSLPPQEKSHARLADEGFELIAAGGETVARVSTAAIYHLVSSPNVLSTVRTEIDTLLSTGADIGIDELEKLPCLASVIKETLRLEAIIKSRLPLVAREPVMYKNWAIPAGTPFSMSPSSIMHNPHCFTEPDSFKPERWLTEGTPNKYFVPFSRGVRSCLGINLAYAELYILVAIVISKFDLELYDTTRENDIDHKRDCFIGKPAKSSRGVRVVLRCRVPPA